MLTASLFAVPLVTFFFVSTSFIPQNILLNESNKLFFYLLMLMPVIHPVHFSLYGSSPAYVAQKKLNCLSLMYFSIPGNSVGC